MAKPIHHSPSSAVAETASVGVSRGLLGAIAGGLLVAAVTIGVPAGIAALGAYALGAGGGAIAGAASVIGLITGVMTWPAITGGAMIGGGAGAIGGVMKRSGRIHEEEIASQNVGNAHDIKLEQQMHEVRAQTAEQYTKVGYAQGVQDGQAAVMQQLQQAAMEQQVAMQQAAPEAAPATEKSFVQSEQMRRGEDGAKTELASHVDRVTQSQENASEHVMGA